MGTEAHKRHRSPEAITADGLRSCGAVMVLTPALRDKTDPDLSLTQRKNPPDFWPRAAFELERSAVFCGIFSQIQKIWVVATIALAAVAAFAGPGYAQKRDSLATENRPEDIVDLKSVAPSTIVDIRYAGPHNFVGRPIPGYDAGKCLVTRPAAEAVASVQHKLTAFGLSLLIYDCYRPQRAVDYFVKWAAGSSDNSMKSEFYPHVKKDDLFKDGYIASPSSHSRGSTVDLTLVPLPQSNLEVYAPGDPLTACDEEAPSRFQDSSLDMGTGYDCFDPKAHLMASGLTSQQRANRMLLAALMAQVGFAGYGNEWWHFTLRNEPYPNTYFDFPIR